MIDDVSDLFLLLIKGILRLLYWVTIGPLEWIWELLSAVWSPRSSGTRTSPRRSRQDERRR